MLWYSLEAPRRGASNKYHNTFLWRNKKKYLYFFAEESTLSGTIFCIQY